MTTAAAKYVGIASGALRLLGRPVPTWAKAFAQCKCGEVVEVKLADYLRGHVKTCGGAVCRLKNNLKAKTYGRLTVVGLASRGNNKRQWKWNVRCSCGRQTEVWGKALTTGNTRSCGCLRRNKSAVRAAKQNRSVGGQFTCEAA